MDITVDSRWVHKHTGSEVCVIWCSDELVSHQSVDGDKTIVPVRKFIFLQNFKERGDE